MIIGKEQYISYINSFLGTGDKSLESIFFSISDENYVVDKKAKSVAIFIDIYDFPNKILNYDASGIISYLKPFYSKVFPIIEKFGGRIDKVMGDGIIAVFSDIFINNNSPYSDIFNDAYYSCKEIIKELSSFKNGKYHSKAAIGYGDLCFCKISSIHYNEITCIGEPLTIVYRLENEADKNQILLLENIPDISNNVINPQWQAKIPLNKKLKGLKQNVINIVELI